MRVCLFGTFDRSDARNRVIEMALRSQGVDLVLCNVPAWPATRERVAASRVGWRMARLLARVLRAHLTLWWRHAHLAPYDVMLVPYPAYLDVLLARLLTLWRRRRVVVDAYLTLYETVVEDRRLVAPHGVVASALRVLDLVSCHMADGVLVDTAAHAAFVADRLYLPSRRIAVIPVGADEGAYAAMPLPSQHGVLRVLYFGNFIPLHGIEHIIGAAHLLRDRSDILWTLIGDGQTYGAMRQMYERLGPAHVTWGPRWLPPADLAKEIAQAHVCLGVFGSSGKASRVIPTKAYIALCMGRALVTMDSPAAREYLRDGKDALLCRPGAEELASAVARLQGDTGLRDLLARQGRALYEREFSPERIGELLVAALQTPF